jgi:hypothetical protein
MTSRTAPTMTRQDFQHLIEVYGAERTRWPLSARAGAAALLAADAEARRMLAEAAALDAVLARGFTDIAPDATVTAALAARIVASAAKAPRLAATSAPSAPLRVSGRPVSSGARTDIWRAAALLAASMVLGIFVGQSQLGAHALPKIAALAGVSFASAERLAMADIEIEASDVD